MRGHVWGTYRSYRDVFAILTPFELPSRSIRCSGDPRQCPLSNESSSSTSLIPPEMPAYHSELSLAGVPEVCGCALLPIKSRSRGPAPSLDPSDPQDDIVDEAIRTFRANVLFRNFEVRNSADRVLIYLSLFIHQVLKRAEKVPTKAEALRQIMPLASGSHIMPGEPTWPLGTLLPAAKSSSELETLRGFFKQLREAVVVRLIERVYNADGSPNKHWLLFAKRKFLGKEFV